MRGSGRRLNAPWRTPTAAPERLASDTARSENRKLASLLGRELRPGHTPPHTAHPPARGFARVQGHLWTLSPALGATFRPPDAGPGIAFRADWDDRQLGAVSVTGVHHPHETSRDLLVVIHGLGGNVTSPYMARPAHVARAHGMSCLRLNLRGADRQGDDIYHGGLVDDITAALHSPQLARYQNVFILGFSMGGHTALRWALSPSDPRVRALATVCTPLDMAQSSAFIDQPRKLVYRRHVLKGLKEIHAATARRGRSPVPLEVIQRIRSLGEWDELLVAPRFGFASAAHYWREMSIGPRLGELRVPALLLATRHDPMVPPGLIGPHLDGLPAPSEVRWLRGGHLGYPSTVRIEEPALAWMRRFALH